MSNILSSHVGSSGTGESADLHLQVQAQHLQDSKHGPEADVGALSPLDLHEEPAAYPSEHGRVGCGEPRFFPACADGGSKLACSADNHGTYVRELRKRNSSSCWLFCPLYVTLICCSVKLHY